jgi:GST-like protein
VADAQRAQSPHHVAGDYSIADIAIFPWYRGADQRGVNIEEYPNVKRWFDAINARPAVQRGLQVLKEVQSANQQPHDDKSWDIMFGKTQFQRR